MAERFDQILSPGSVHEGNSAPPTSIEDPDLRRECLRLGGKAGRWLHAQGYRGTASADFHVATRACGDVEMRICELNARVTDENIGRILEPARVSLDNLVDAAINQRWEFDFEGIAANNDISVEGAASAQHSGTGGPPCSSCRMRISRTS